MADGWLPIRRGKLVDEVEVLDRGADAMLVQARFDGRRSWTLTVHRTGREDALDLAGACTDAMMNAYWVAKRHGEAALR